MEMLQLPFVSAAGSAFIWNECSLHWSRKVETMLVTLLDIQIPFPAGIVIVNV